MKTHMLSKTETREISFYSCITCIYIEIRKGRRRSKVAKGTLNENPLLLSISVFEKKKRRLFEANSNDVELCTFSVNFCYSYNIQYLLIISLLGFWSRSAISMFVKKKFTCNQNKTLGAYEILINYHEMNGEVTNGNIRHIMPVTLDVTNLHI